MELKITSKNMKLTSDAHQLIERKFTKLKRHLPNITESKIEITEERTKSPQQRFVAQITLNNKGTLLRAEERGQSMFNAVDKVVTIMDRQIERYKSKLYNKGRGSSLARGESSSETQKKSKEERITRVKRFVIEPMDISEAIDSLEFLGHDFFLFINEDIDKFNVVYRRRDGGYGLIDPQQK